MRGICHPGAGAQGNLRASDDEGRRKRSQQMIDAQFQRIRARAHEQKGEFIAAKPRQDRVLANHAAHSSSDLDEQRVACGMAMTVVHRFEPIKVDQRQSDVA